MIKLWISAEVTCYYAFTSFEADRILSLILLRKQSTFSCKGVVYF